MAKVVIGSITLRSGFSSEWNRQVPEGDSLWNGYVLQPGEIGIEKPSTVNILDEPYLMKIGDGVSMWKDLPYVGASASEGYISTDAISVDNNRNLINLVCSQLETNASMVVSDGLYTRDRGVRVYQENYEYAQDDFIVSEDFTEFGFASDTFTSTTWKQDITNFNIRKITPIFSQEEVKLNTQTLNVYIKQDTGKDLEGTRGTREDPFSSIAYAVYSVRKRMLGKNLAIKINLLNNDNGDVSYSLIENPDESYLNNTEAFSFKDVVAIEGEDKNSIILKDVYLEHADLTINNVRVSSSTHSNIPPLATIKSSKILFKNCEVAVDPNFDASTAQTSMRLDSSYVIFSNCELVNTLGTAMESYLEAESSVVIFHNTELGGQKILDDRPIIKNEDTLVVLNLDWNKEYCGPTATYGDMADYVASNEETVIGTPYQYIRRNQIGSEVSWDLDLLEETRTVTYDLTEYADNKQIVPKAFKPIISGVIKHKDSKNYKKFYYIGPRLDKLAGYMISAISPEGEEYISAGDGDKPGIEWVAKNKTKTSKIYTEPNPDNGEVAHYLDRPEIDQYMDNDLYKNTFVEDNQISSLARVSDTFTVFGTPFKKDRIINITQGFIIKFNEMKRPKIRFKKDNSGQYIDRFAASALKFGGEGENQYLGWHTKVEGDSIYLVFSIFVIRENKFVDIKTIYDGSSVEPWSKTEIKLHRPIESSITDSQIIGGYTALDEDVHFPLLWANIGYVIVTSGEKIPYIAPAKITADYIIDKDNRVGIVTNAIQDTEIEVETLRIDVSAVNTARYVLDPSEELPQIGDSRIVSWNMFDVNPIFDGKGYEKIPTTGQYEEVYQIDIEECNRVEDRQPCKIEDIPDVEYVKIVNPEDKIVGEAIVKKKTYGLPVFQITPTQFDGSFDAFDTLDGGNLD